MNNFAGPSDTDNFPPSDEQMRYSSELMQQEADDADPNTPFMGNHIVKTVRNLRMK